MTNAAVKTNDKPEATEIEEPTPRQRAETVNMGFSLPIAMRVAIDVAANQRKISPTSLVRQAVADAIGYTLPAAPERKVSVAKNSEEAKAAKLAADQAHRQRMRELLNRHRQEAGLPVEEAK